MWSAEWKLFVRADQPGEADRYRSLPLVGLKILNQRRPVSSINIAEKLVDILWDESALLALIH